MARFSAGFRSTGAGSTTLPLGSLYASANVRLILREIHVTNTTATASDMAVRAFTATGTQGSGITEVEYDVNGPTPTGTVFDTHTVTPTITAGTLKVASLPAAIGGGPVWVFGGDGYRIPAGVANGVGVIVLTGTGQICDLTFVWDE